MIDLNSIHFDQNESNNGINSTYIAPISKDARLSLPEEFLSHYYGRQPEWGALGYVTYKRTYARVVENENRREEWYETVKRVVEGTFSIQKQHCINQGLPWIEEKAIESAKIMFRKIWEFKFLPPGRGLWMMGTKFVEERGGAALNNCAFRSTADIAKEKSKIFRWVMDQLMLGVGVGFDTKGQDKVTVVAPKVDTKVSTFLIPDSREGWVEALGYVIDGYLSGKPIPNFDYTLIRPAGAPIRGFGGVASGPDPLRELLQDLSSIFKERLGQTLRGIDILDIMCNIGRCVVAGNVRRSALIALVDLDDDACIEAKDPEIMGAFPEDSPHARRWSANISVSVKMGDDYSKLIPRIVKNGEPGLVWLDNARFHSRMCEPPNKLDAKASGVNPCFHGDTLIAVADGRGAVSIRQLAEEDRDVPVYSVNANGMIEIKMGRHPRITGYDQELVQITLDDGSTLIVTPNHKMRLLNGEMVEAKDLQIGESLTRFSKYTTKFKSDGTDYLMIRTNTLDMKKRRLAEHRLIAQFHHPDQWQELYEEDEEHGWLHGNLVVHHKNENGLDNRIDNLEILKFSDHNATHEFYDVSGVDNPMYGKFHSADTKAKIGQKTVERSADPDYMAKQRQAIADGMHTPEVHQILSDTRKRELKKYYEEFERTTDLETAWIEDQLYVVKYCEVCNAKMVLEIGLREQAYCSIACSNKSPFNVVRRTIGQRKYFADKQKDILHQQVMIYKDLEKTLGHTPSKKEWEVACKSKEISCRCNPHSPNEFVLKSFKDLQQRASTYNHRVTNVDRLPYRSNVYNITVDDNHTVCVVTKYNTTTKECDGIATANCGEQTLESTEMCCLVETFPSNHAGRKTTKTELGESLLRYLREHQYNIIENGEEVTLDAKAEYIETLKYAYMYAKTVTLLPTHWSETNKVMTKNRRIGTSQSGIIPAFEKHGRQVMMQWCRDGYDYIRELDRKYTEDWFGGAFSKKIASVKPSGTVSLLAGVAPGIHYPHSEYYIRTIRMDSKSPMLPEIIRCGYKIIDDPNSVVYERDAQGNLIKVDGKPVIKGYSTKIAEFPVHEKNFQKSKTDVTLWEQIANAIDYQRYWSDNQVSITATFKPTEVKDLPAVLSFIEDKLKGITFLPEKPTNYANAPYQEISKEEYDRRVAMVKGELDFSKILNENEEERFCEACVVKEEKKDATTHDCNC